MSVTSSRKQEYVEKAQRLREEIRAAERDGQPYRAHVKECELEALSQEYDDVP